MPWTVIQTQPNAAKKACENIERQDFTYYNPIIDERVVKRGYVMIRRAQLFRDYLFVLVMDGRWSKLKSTIGVRQVMAWAGEPGGHSAEEVIESLKARENADGVVVLKNSIFKPGQLVQVKKGPCEYALGTFDGQSARDRVFVLMSWLGSTRRVEINEGNLAAV